MIRGLTALRCLSSVGPHRAAVAATNWNRVVQNKIFHRGTLRSFADDASAKAKPAEAPKVERAAEEVSSGSGTPIGNTGVAADAAKNAKEERTLWGLGQKKEKYDPFDKNFQPAMPFTKPLSPISKILLTLSAVGGSAYAVYKFQELEIPEKDPLYVGVEGDFSLKLSNKLRYVYKMFTEPYRKVLLPEPLPPPYFRPYTLVVGLEGVLTANVWDAKMGNRVAKRPGLEAFLSYISQMYEVVVFTSSAWIYSGPVLDQLDPQMARIMYRLYKDSTVYTNGEYVKDLSHIGRPLEKVIIVDNSERAVSAQPENSIIVSTWTGDPNDRELIDLIPFLENIFTQEVADVRDVLRAWGHKDVGKKYQAKQAELRAALEEEKRLAQAQGGSAPARGKGGLFSLGRN